MIHTIETVKRYLPDVKVKIGNRIVACKVTGHMEYSATVIVDGVNYEFNWQSIVNSLNNDKPLRVV